jgi:tetratricopeptide (TPR) repeat protein
LPLQIPAGPLPLSFLPKPSQQRGAALLCAVGLAFLMGSRTTLAQGDPASARVVQMLRAQQFQAAEEEAQRLLAVHPHDCRLLSLKGLALNGMKDLPAAKKAFDQALEVCPNDLLPLEGAAQIAYAQKSPDAAALLKRILVLRPEDVTTHAMLAAVYRSKEQCLDALPHFEASQAMFAAHPELQEGYAFCLASTGDDAKAATNYQESLERHPDAAARYNLAIVQSRLHDPGAALKTLEPLLSGGSEAPLELGSQLAEDAGDTPQAVQLLREAILRNSKNADNYLRFAELSFTHNSYQVGIDMLNAGLTQLPKAGRLYLARGVLEVQLSQFEKAIADFEKAHQLEPQLSLAMDAIGIMQSQQHQSTESLKLFAEQAQRHPNDALLQYLYAEALSEGTPGKDTLAQAIAAAEHSVKLEPGYEPARGLLALLYLRANQPQRAATEAEAALKIDPSDDTALYQEVMARRRLGQTAEVQKLVQRLTELRRSKAAEQKQKKGYVLKDESSR